MHKAEKTWPTDKLAEIKIADVCKNCNEALGRTIEEPVKPIIAPLIAGKSVTLTTADQGALAAWLFKIATLFRYLGQPSREATRQELDDLFLRRVPSTGTVIYVASYTGKYRVKLVSYQVGLVRAQSTAEFMKLLKLREWDKAELATLVVGHFAAQIALYPADTHFTYGATGSLVRQIWPCHGPVDWPPPMYVDDSGLDSLATTEIV